MPTGPVPLFLAPMAGVTDLAYRLLASECGADFTMTEFTAASGLSRKEAKSWLKRRKNKYALVLLHITVHTVIPML